MPLAFSTLGCPGAPFDEVVALAHAHGAQGVELRAADGAPVNASMPYGQRRALRGHASRAGIRIIAVDSYLRVCEPGPDDEFLADARAHLRLAGDLGAAGLRLFPGQNGAGPAGRRRAVRRLAALADEANAIEVRLLLETHDSRPRGQDLHPILEDLDRDHPGHGVGVIWDVLHPWRAGETPSETARLIGGRPGYVQIKDARSGPAGELTLVGDGDVPLDEIAAVAPDAKGTWWSLEWEKAWLPDLPELDVALTAAERWFRRCVDEPGAPSRSRCGQRTT